VASLAERFSSLTTVAASERTLPVHPCFVDVLPALQRGSTIACTGGAKVSLALGLASGASQEGSWVGVAGLPEIGVCAAADIGLALERLVMVGGDPSWVDVLAAMIDGFDVIIVGPRVGRLGSTAVRRLQARLQARGAVLIAVDVPALGADLQFVTDGEEWVGLGAGHGVATGRRAAVELSGRRMPRPRRAALWLPDARGCPAVLDEHASVLSRSELRHEVLTGAHRRIAG
jgi:hypothetical protein